MRSPEPPTPVFAEHLGALHRYASLLMGGEPVGTAAALDATLDRAAACSGDIRCPMRAARWLFAEVRIQCRRRSSRKRAAAAAAPEGAAGAFASLPEPERAALALFYVGPFRRLELSDTLGVRPEDLGPLLQRARLLLGAPTAEMETAVAPGPAEAVSDPALAVN